MVSRGIRAKYTLAPIEKEVSAFSQAKQSSTQVCRASLFPAYSTKRERESQTESLASTKMQKLNYLWVGSPVSLWGTSPKRLWEFPSSFSQGECLEQPFSMEISKDFPIPLLQSLGHQPGFKENIEHGSLDNPDLSSYLFAKRVHF